MSTDDIRKYIAIVESQGREQVNEIGIIAGGASAAFMPAATAAAPAWVPYVAMGLVGIAVATTIAALIEAGVPRDAARAIAEKMGSWAHKNEKFGKAFVGAAESAKKGDHGPLHRLIDYIKSKAEAKTK